MMKFLKDESGATAIEYGLIAVSMALMLLVAAPPLAAAVSTLYGKLTVAVSTF
ncbi:MAG: Flp family type IVb pilin [Aestuariivirga sp.]